MKLIGYLKKFRKKMKNGARLIVSGPTENFCYRVGRRLAEFFSGNGDFTGHYHHTNIDKLESTITSLGFNLIEKKLLPFNVLALPSLFKVLSFKADGVYVSNG